MANFRDLRKKIKRIPPAFDLALFQGHVKLLYCYFRMRINKSLNNI